MVSPLNLEFKRSKDGLYNYNIKARNGEVLYTSEHYTNKKDANLCAEELISALSDGKYGRRIEFDVFRKPYISVITKNGVRINSAPYENMDELRGGFERLEYAIKKISKIKFDNWNSSSEEDSRIGSVVEFVTKVFSIKREKGCAYYFRGHSDYRYELVPGIYRKGKGWINHEHKLFREIMLRCPVEFRGNSTTFQNLVKMQHYALPTRLLDITTNALMALYFACVGEAEKKQDGEVIVFNINESEIKYYDDSEVSLLSNLSKQDYLFSLDDKSRPKNREDLRVIQDISINKRRIMDAAKRDGCYIESVYFYDFQKVVCVKPEMDNPRIIRQDGAFLLFGMDREKKMPPIIPPAYLYNHPEGKLIIKSESKESIIAELESLGISSSGVYPEIEHVASHIKNKYS
ncbi:FRG domain-containing protein [Serratia marcescens]|uniref:FRG domain-containing protein n=1 Tax=Serratia marcescens TaxID=615 RepID=UPI0009B29DEF|nr:FRG domain-containing protein [Serratia marcescens]MBH3101231.1 FRG domain-containing protein [Serratia marcescens]MBH3220883.1 FRG domain-containing protein [Serratia marcescens]